MHPASCPTLFLDLVSRAAEIGHCQGGSRLRTRILLEATKVIHPIVGSDVNAVVGSISPDDFAVALDAFPLIGRHEIRCWYYGFYGSEERLNTKLMDVVTKKVRYLLSPLPCAQCTLHRANFAGPTRHGRRGDSNPWGCMVTRCEDTRTRVEKTGKFSATPRLLVV
jgi:hypothetical protein